MKLTKILFLFAAVILIGCSGGSSEMKKNEFKINPELLSKKIPMTSREKVIDIEQVNTLPVSSRRKSIIEGMYDYWMIFVFNKSSMTDHKKQGIRLRHL